MSNFWYLASAHSHERAEERERRFEHAMRAIAYLFKRRVWAFSPIVHAHTMAIRYDLSTTDFRFWQEYDETMIRASRGVIVLKEPYWRESKGVASEIAFARSIGYELKEMLRESVKEYIIRGFYE